MLLVTIAGTGFVLPGRVLSTLAPRVHVALNVAAVLDPLVLIQDKDSQHTSRRLYVPQVGVETATLALG